MKKIELLITIPEYKGRETYLHKIESVSPRLAVRHRICMTPEETADALEGVEILYTYAVP